MIREGGGEGGEGRLVWKSGFCCDGWVIAWVKFQPEKARVPGTYEDIPNDNVADEPGQTLKLT